jgi:hypothetical protein
MASAARIRRFAQVKTSSDCSEDGAPPRRRGSIQLRSAAAVLAAAMLGGVVSACAAHSGSAATGASAACRETHYVLQVSPRTVVSNERQHVHVRASRDACAGRTPIRGGRVTLNRVRATTDARGRATLTVRLQTGRYLVRLYQRGRISADARVKAIPNVAH